MSQIIKGIAASDGIGIAKAYTLTEPDLSFEKSRLTIRLQSINGLRMLLTSRSQNWRPSNKMPKAA